MKITLQHQLSIALENQPGRLAQVSRLLAKLPAAQPNLKAVISTGAKRSGEMTV